MPRLFALMTLLFAVACGAPDGGGEDRTADALGRAGSAAAPSYVEEFARVRLPASTDDLTARSYSGIDEMLFARFTIAQEDLAAFIGDARLTAAPEEGYRAIGTAPDSLGWDPQLNALGRFLGHEEFDGGFARKLVIGLDDPQRPVYLVATTV